MDEEFYIQRQFTRFFPKWLWRDSNSGGDKTSPPTFSDAMVGFLVEYFCCTFVRLNYNSSLTVLISRLAVENALMCSLFSSLNLVVSSRLPRMVKLCLWTVDAASGLFSMDMTD